ncbi:2685_t:CDS:2, partial [Ambispora gerdemannii]
MSNMKISSSKLKRQCNINWMISYNNPTPLEFFRFITPTHKSRAIEKYGKCLDEAIDFCEDSDKQSKLRNLKETINCNSDWELWLIEKKSRSIRDEIHETNMEVHQELNTLVRNGGRQKIIVYDILDCDISATQAELDILEIYRSKFNNYPAMDLRLHSELSLSLDQELQDKILHEVFDEIDKDYITDEIHNFLTDFFNADHGKQGWHESVRRIVINEKDSELLQDTKELLKGTLGRFIKAFSLDALNPLRDVTMLERPQPIYTSISLQGKAKVIADGVGYLNDVSNYQIVCMEGARPGARNDKNVNDDKKNIKSMIQLFNYIIVTETSERRQVYTGLRVYGATACKTELSLTMLDFRGTYRLFEVDRFSLPKDWVDMSNFVFMYEALIKWA